MTDDRIAGKAKNLGGRAQEAYGDVTGDVGSQVRGRLRQAEGAARTSTVRRRTPPPRLQTVPGNAQATSRTTYERPSSNGRTQSPSRRSPSAICLVAWAAAIIADRAVQ